MGISRIRALQEIEDLRAPSLTIARSFDTSLHTAFAAWIKPDITRLWWAPKSCTPFAVRQEPKVGGTWRIGMARALGVPDVWQAGKYLEITEPKRLIMTFAWEQPGVRSDETILTVNFSSQGSRTWIHLHQGIFESIPYRDAHYLGWSEAFDRLEGCLRDRPLPVQSLGHPFHYAR